MDNAVIRVFEVGKGTWCQIRIEVTKFPPTSDTAEVRWTEEPWASLLRAIDAEMEKVTCPSAQMASMLPAEPMPRHIAWLKMYYPVAAEDMKGQSPIKLVEHGLRKWEGAAEGLEPFGLTYEGHEVRDGRTSVLGFGCLSCALCLQYYWDSTDNCESCPLYRHTGYSCFDWRSAYARSGYDARPMVEALRGTLEMLQREENSALFPLSMCPCGWVHLGVCPNCGEKQSQVE